MSELIIFSTIAMKSDYELLRSLFTHPEWVFYSQKFIVRKFDLKILRAVNFQLAKGEHVKSASLTYLHIFKLNHDIQYIS